VWGVWRCPSSRAQRGTLEVRRKKQRPIKP
jgi:hypothetical protein